MTASRGRASVDARSAATAPVLPESPRLSTGTAPALVLVRPWPDRPRDEDLALLTADERAWMTSLVRPRDAAGFAAGRALLREAAARRLACAAGDVPLVAPPGHRARIAGSAVACSIAHGGDVVLAAVSDADRLGVDVERVDPTIPVLELAQISRHVLAAPRDEVAALLAGTQSRRTFFARWTLTEAVLKAIGTGLVADPRAVRLDLGRLTGRPGGQPRLVAAPGLDADDESGWRLELFEPAVGHVAALVERGSLGPASIEQVG